MPQLTRKRLLLAKIEGTYGTDPTPTVAANALQVVNMTINPLASTIVPRNIIRPTLGNFQQLVANTHVEVDFEVEIAGAGTAGTAPAYGPLLRACAMSQTLLAAALTGTAQAGASGSITLAAGASSTDNAYAGLPISLTGGTGSGQSGIITAYNGTTKVATVLAAWGVTPDATTTYSIAASAAYRPVSTSFESVTLYYFMDSVLHKITGARGTVELGISANSIPMFKFKMVGLYNGPSDTSPGTPTYTQQVPVIANNTNTTGFSFFGITSWVLQQLNLNVNTTPDFRSLIGAEYVQITDRQSNGDVAVEGVSMATFNAFSTAIGDTTGSLAITHGTTTGNKVAIVVPYVDIQQPSYEDNNGVNMLKMTYVAMPSAGNDEFNIVVL